MESQHKPKSISAGLTAASFEDAEIIKQLNHSLEIIHAEQAKQAGCHVVTSAPNAPKSPLDLCEEEILFAIGSVGRAVAANAMVAITI